MTHRASQERNKEIVSAFVGGKSAKEIAEYYQLTCTSICKILRKACVWQPYRSARIRRQEIIDLYESGLTMKEISDIKKIDYAVVSTSLHVASVPRHSYKYIPTRPPNLRNIEIKKKYEDGLSMSKLGREYNVSTQRILQILIKQGTKLRGRKSKKS